MPDPKVIRKLYRSKERITVSTYSRETIKMLRGEGIKSPRSHETPVNVKIVQ